MPEPRSRLSPALLALLTLLAAAPDGRAQEVEPGAPYVPTPMNVVAEMLRLADPSPGDTVYDLGSGDGRLPIAAARTYGAHGVGVEIDSALVARSRRHAREAGVDSLVRFVRGDLFEMDLHPASVVTLYLFPDMNERLRPKILRQMEPGARVVAHDFSMGAWRADSVVHVREGSPSLDLFDELEEGWERFETRGRRVDSLLPDPGPAERHATVYLWVIPADVDGTWRVRLPNGDTRRVEIDQRFQELRVAGRDRAGGAWVRADSVRLALETDGRTLRLRGTVSGDRMRGRAADGGAWSARRVEGTAGSVLEWEGDARGYSEGRIRDPAPSATSAAARSDDRGRRAGRRTSRSSGRRRRGPAGTGTRNSRFRNRRPGPSSPDRAGTGPPAPPA